MGNHKLITRIFKNAKHISFNNNDRLVFFSDVHRGNNSWADEFAPNETIYLYALQHYYDSGFTYVEVGDGDELLKFKYVEPIRVAHEQVYRLLKKFQQKRRLHYIFGNHDDEYRRSDLPHFRPTRIFNTNFDDPKIIFCGFKVQEGLVFKHEESNVELFVFHGHQGDDLFHRFIWLSRVLLRAFWRPLQLLGLQDPSSVAQNIYKRQKVEEELIKWSADHKQPILCGHTHQERFPKSGAAPYFNDGSCVHPRWITCIEIEDGEISLIRWRIKPDKKGRLVVKRNILKGPKPIKNFS